MIDRRFLFIACSGTLLESTSKYSSKRSGGLTILWCSSGQTLWVHSNTCSSVTSAVTRRSRFLTNSLNRQGGMIDRARGILSMVFSGTSYFPPHCGYTAHLLEETLWPWSEPVCSLKISLPCSDVKGIRFMEIFRTLPNGFRGECAYFRLFQGTRNHVSLLCKAYVLCLQFIHSSYIPDGKVSYTVVGFTPISGLFYNETLIML